MRLYFNFCFRVSGVPRHQIGPGKHARKKFFGRTPLKMAIFRPKSRHIGSRRSRLQNSLKQLISPGNLGCDYISIFVFVFLGSLGQGVCYRGQTSPSLTSTARSRSNLADLDYFMKFGWNLFISITLIVLCSKIIKGWLEAVISSIGWAIGFK